MTFDERTKTVTDDDNDDSRHVVRRGATSAGSTSSADDFRCSAPAPSSADDRWGSSPTPASADAPSRYRCYKLFSWALTLFRNTLEHLGWEETIPSNICEHSYQCRQRSTMRQKIQMTVQKIWMLVRLFSTHWSVCPPKVFSRNFNIYEKGIAKWDPCIWITLKKATP